MEFSTPRVARPLSIEGSRTAALQGKALLDEGYTAISAAPVSVDEFRTFNRLLDSAISDAVASFGRRRDSVPSEIRISANGAAPLGTSSAP
jgi:hypothetical protein